MLYYLLYPLKKYFIGFNLFRYITFRAAYAIITALILSFIIGPKIIRWAKRKKLGEVIRDDGPKHHESKAGTPSMGGLMIIFSTVVSVLLWGKLENIYLILFLITIFFYGLLGFLDDYIKIVKKNKKGLHAKVKLWGQIIISAVVMVILFLFFENHSLLTELYVPFFKKAVLDMGWIYFVFGILIMVGSSNAVNLTDGLDGLAIGSSLLVLAAFTIIAYLSGHIKIAEYLMIPYIKDVGEVTIFGAALIGAALGFLWYNAHPADIFMGDTGALSIGGTIGLFSIVLKKELLLLILGGVFVIEALSVIIQVVSFKLTGKRVFKMAPIHHHYELKGVPESKIIIRVWIIGLILALIGLTTLKIR